MEQNCRKADKDILKHYVSDNLSLMHPKSHS